MKRTFSALIAIAVCLGQVGFSPATHAAEPAKAAASRTAEQILPASTVLYVEVTRPQDLFQHVLNHPLGKQLQSTPQYQAFVNSEEGKKVKNIVDYIEFISTGGSVHLAVDAKSFGAALLVKVDAAKQKGLEKRVVDFVEKSLADAGNDVKLEPNNYRGINTYRVDKGGFCTVGPWIVFINNRDFGKTLLDNLLDGSNAPLTANKEYTTAKKQVATGSSLPTVWAYGKISLIRSMGLMNAILKDKSDNIGLEFIAGGVLETLRHTPYVTASIDIKADALSVSLATPFDSKKIPSTRMFYFSSDRKGSASKELRPEGTLLTITTHRDAAGMFRAIDELFTENVAAEFTKGESQLSTFFGGRDFVDDILGNIRPQIQIIAARQKYTAVTPAIKYPAGAMVVRLKKADELTQAQFKSAFMSLMSIINLDGMNKGRSMLLLDIEKHNGANVYTSKYSVDPETTKKDAAEEHYNFSPTMAVYKDWIIVSSTNQLAKQLVDEAKKSSDELIKSNTRIQLDAKIGHQMLVDNREQLIANNQIEKGHSRTAAANEIDWLLAALKYVKGADIDLSFTDDTARLSATIKLAETK